ncbi:unnamed protein product [Bursaphelenchus xylophilus]|uniref:(pine wood nematode) hypothetical protein n=1 Tax=Bursaphelenchus xylophilus TaxID=6326 RepID=A0A7I8WIH3_BURXY|nr:unnamed protein product [Bursaphelenchus xylophilus]CAG9108902.1 unnamed protein product [Bursaphelenchus xylophilus]
MPPRRAKLKRPKKRGKCALPSRPAGWVALMKLAQAATLTFCLFVFGCAGSILAQETLSCGQASYQVNFEPAKPQVASGPAKYTFYPIELLFGANVQICNLTSPNPPLGEGKTATINGLETRFIITYCESCSRCISKLPILHKMATQVATDAGLTSMLIIVRNSFQGVKLDNTNVKFVQMDEEPEVSNVCELVDSVDSDALRSFSKTSVLFVSISFIILMVISLAWLVFYYVQRFRYAHAKDRLQRRLFNAAKKALTHIPTKPVKAGDKELDSDCPVCIDPYRAGDIVRMLPCRHVFHKTCVDPWLLEHRTCPMCKSDILKAFGYHVNVSSRRRTQFSAPNDDQHVVHVANEDRLSVDANSTTSESNAYPFPVVTEIHDPFSFTPSTSPQLVQVMHATNARGFSIIPLTVHSANATTNGPNYTTVNATVERHVPSFSSPVCKSEANSSTCNTGRQLRNSSSAKRNRGHFVNLVHVRSRSLSHSQVPDQLESVVPEAVQPQRPTALFRTGRGGTDIEKQTEESPQIMSPPSPAPVSLPNIDLSSPPDQILVHKKYSPAAAHVKHAMVQSAKIRPQTTGGVGVRRLSGEPNLNTPSSPTGSFHDAPDSKPIQKDGISVESL